ncbi:MAG: XRE family transcriptional regulator [Candidatus Binatia bacterium]
MKEKKKTNFEEWFDVQLHTDSNLNRQVEETLQAMRIEQDLVALREARGVSQTQLAKTLGVSQPAVAKLESGKARNIELRTLVRAVSALGGTVEIKIKKPTGASKPTATQKKNVA